MAPETAGLLAGPGRCQAGAVPEAADLVAGPDRAQARREPEPAGLLAGQAGVQAGTRERRRRRRLVTARDWYPKIWANFSLFAFLFCIMACI